MKPLTRTPLLRPTAFTLIELLVVIAVIAILAALLFPVTVSLKRKRIVAVAQAELASVETAIESYKATRGHYPPDNPGNFISNQLFFELKGTVLTNLGGVQTYVTLDGSGQIPQSMVLANFGVTGFVNSSAGTRGDDDKAAAQNYIKDLKPNQSGAISAGSTVRLLTCSVLWEKAPFPVTTDTTGINPWRYISTRPTNNATSYDLWVDVLIGNKTNRISNWNKAPQVVAY